VLDPKHEGVIVADLDASYVRPGGSTRYEAGLRPPVVSFAAPSPGSREIPTNNGYNELHIAREGITYNVRVRRIALLRVLTEQNDAVSAMVRAQRRVTDVDPTTGAELDSEDGPIEPMPEG